MVRRSSLISCTVHNRNDQSPRSSESHADSPEAGSRDGLTPTTNAEEISRDVPELQSALFRAILAEPTTGVGVISSVGQVIYINEQAAQMFHGTDAKAAHYVGSYWRDHMPPEWVEERLRVFRAMLIHDKPVLMRVIWRGYQHFTWISRVEYEETDASAGVHLFLTITRRAGNDSEAESFMPKAFEEVESGVVRLGRLSSLSPRELEVLALLGQGLSVPDAARILHRSEHTIATHVKTLYSKLDISDRVELAEIAVRSGVTLRDVNKVRV
jgi:DNA-binding CsgD family transcriptional regulator